MAFVEGIPLKEWRRPIVNYLHNVGRDQAEDIVNVWMVDRKFASVETFNDASGVLFLNYTADLEGLKNSDGVGTGSRWKNLPYWLASIWLPLNGDAIDPVVDDTTGEPVLIATATGLIRDLDEIAQMSKLRLGEEPQLFRLMLDEPKSFYSQTADKTFSDEEAIQWLWYAYRWAARAALSNSLVVWQGG